MRFKKLKRYLKVWQETGLITEEQANKIAEFMKVEFHRQFLKLIRLLFILGGFWLVFGLIATLRLINVEIFFAIWHFLNRLASPIVALARLISPKHYQELLSGVACLVGWGLFHWFGIRLRNRSQVTMTQLGFLQEKELRLGTASFTIGYILASAAWPFFNAVIFPDRINVLAEREFFFPLFSLVGMVFFLSIAYWMQDQIALLFGIAFLSHLVGLWTQYFFATYVIGVQMPVMQLVVGVLLLFVGLWHIEKVRARETHFQFLFGRTYEWTGLVFIYLSLWIMSIWGITAHKHWHEPLAGELWIANILFIVGSLGALFYGAAKEDKMFFNFGLTFFIIESYTLFFSRIWATLGAAFGSLVLGVMLIATGYALRHLWLKGQLFKKASG